MKGGNQPDKFLAEKRLQKKLKRKLIVERRFSSARTGETRLGPRQLIFSDSLLGFISRRAIGVAYAQKIHDPILTIPERFSIISNPDAVIATLNKLVASAVYSPHFSGSFIDHSKVVEYDLAAEYILGKIASEIDRAYTRANKPLRFSGRFPSNMAETRLLTAIGIVKLLRAKHDAPITGNATDLEIFQTHRRQGAEEIAFGSRDRKSNSIVKFVDHIDNCLKRNDRVLSAYGKDSLATYAGEVLANAEEHTKRGEWMLAGYLDNSTEEHLCEIVVISFGDTFAESFRRLRLDNYAWVTVQPYLDAHLKGGLFSPKWEVDDLLALVALQGGISCKNASPSDTRGKGTIDLIRFFEDMHRECSRGTRSVCEMAILTGQTYIRFDGTHSLRRDSSGRDVIAFNSTNTLKEAPDPNYVKRLENRFPGTIISMRFSMRPKFTAPAQTLDHS